MLDNSHFLTAYDSSGRYRGQLLFGNDKWLGQLVFCLDLNRQLPSEERKHFELEFYVADITLHLPHLNRTVSQYLSQSVNLNANRKSIAAIVEPGRVSA